MVVTGVVVVAVMIVKSLVVAIVSSRPTVCEHLVRSGGESLRV